VALRKQDAKRYPDAVFVRLILEHSDDLILQQQVQEAVDQLMTQMAIPT
jgi:hypothetical protein